jgi:hypothetical protein
MPPLPSEWLREIDLAEFAPSAKRDIEAYGHDWAGRPGVDPTERNRFQAFIEFGAVEFALMPFYRGGLQLYNHGNILENVPLPNPPIFPVRVTDRDAADAIYKTDCGPFREHRMKEQYELRPWDVFAFAGDMSKAELLGFTENINVLAEPAIMQNLLTQLSERYSQAGLGDRVVESRLLAAQGFIWFAKLALLRGEDYTERRLGVGGW